MMSKSPWLDHRYNNIFLDEISLVEDPIPGIDNRPMEAFVWICENKAKELLFNALADLVPLFPVRSYHNEVSSWLSSPPDGISNTVFVVIGKDSKENIIIV